jgi:hypothetical protein
MTEGLLNMLQVRIDILLRDADIHGNLFGGELIFP